MYTEVQIEHREARSACHLLWRSLIVWQVACVRTKILGTLNSTRPTKSWFLFRSFRTRFLIPDDSVAGSELGPWRHHGWWPWRPLAIPRVRVTSPTSCHGEWTWTLQALGPHMFTFQGAAVRRLELRSGVTTLTYFHISRVVSFLHSISFRFHDVFHVVFLGWNETSDIMRRML